MLSHSNTEEPHEEYKAIQMDLTYVRITATVKHISLCFSIVHFFWPAFDDLFLSKNQNHPLVLTSPISGLSRLHYLLPLGTVNQSQLMRL